MKQLITLAAVFAAFTVTAQNVGINTDGSTPTMMLDIKTSAASGDNGILINNTAATADAFIQLQVDATPLWTLGVDDSDADEFKIARSTALGTSNAFTINSNRQLLSTIGGTESVPAWSFETDVNTGIWQNNADELMISAGGREFLTLDEGGATNNTATFNIDGDDMDFRIESDDDPDMFFVNGNTNRIGIGTAAPAEELHVEGDARVTNLAGTGTRVVTTDANGTLTQIAAGTNGQVLMQTAAGPAYASSTNINSVTNTADLLVTSGTYGNLAGMTLTFTATQTTALLMLSASGLAFTNSMAFVSFRVRNGTTVLGGTTTCMQSYDDVTGTLTPWSASFSKMITGLTIGTTYTYRVQGLVAGILGTPSSAMYTASFPDDNHLTLSIIQ